MIIARVPLLNNQTKEMVNTVEEVDVLILAIPGYGSSDILVAEMDDVMPVAEGIAGFVRNLGYSCSIMPYYRTGPTVLGRIAIVKDYIRGFLTASRRLAADLEESISVSAQGRKAIMVGLSFGASLVVRTYLMLTPKARESVYLIALGTPFQARLYPNNVLVLNNDGADMLARGNVPVSLWSFLTTPVKWAVGKARGETKIARYIEIPGHEYSWSSPAISPPIVDFLQRRLGTRAP